MKCSVCGTISKTETESLLTSYSLVEAPTIKNQKMVMGGQRVAKISLIHSTRTFCKFENQCLVNFKSFKSSEKCMVSMATRIVILKGVDLQNQLYRRLLNLVPT